VVISLDPWRDTPAALPAIASMWELGADDRVLSGPVAEVERTLDALRVGRQRNTNTGDIVHSGTVMVLDARGHIVWRLDGGWGRISELLAAMPQSKRTS
jgi:cytochrome oxidase Cu insertion factor (SCO1/SenC/PrrC family)